MINIYGSIGYCLLKRDEKNVLVFSDMHSKLPYCNEQSIKISQFILGKIKSSAILLEEVDRTEIKNNKLNELWDTSEHTRELKELFLNNPNVIHAIDIRPMLIPFSWELIKFNTNNITLKNYLLLLNNFFNFKIDKIKEELDNYYSIEAPNIFHFNLLKDKFSLFIEKNRENLDLELFFIYSFNKNLLDSINDLLDEIMEWYTVSKLEKLNIKNNIIHTGLYHSENIIKLLLNKYNYRIIIYDGINKLSNDIDNKITNGCIKIPSFVNSLL
jgi:hypothetical protein